MYIEPSKCPIKKPRDNEKQDLSPRFGCLPATYFLIVAIHSVAHALIGITRLAQHFGAVRTNTREDPQATAIH